MRRQKTKTQHLCKNVGAELIRSNIVTHCRHAGPISGYLYRGKPSVPIGSDFLRNNHGFAQIVSNCLEIRFIIAPLLLERQAVEDDIASSITARLSAFTDSSSVVAKPSCARDAASRMLASRRSVLLFFEPRGRAIAVFIPKSVGVSEGRTRTIRCIGPVERGARFALPP